MTQIQKSHPQAKLRRQVSYDEAQRIITYGVQVLHNCCIVLANRKSGLLFIGTGKNNGLPLKALSDSLLALNYRTSNPDGELVWHYQYTNDDTTEIPSLFKDCDADGGPILLDLKGHPRLKKWLFCQIKKVRCVRMIVEQANCYTPLF